MTHALMMEAKAEALYTPAIGIPARVAVIGCGAMTRDFHLPVLAGHEGAIERGLRRKACQ